MKRAIVTISQRDFLDFLKATCAAADLPNRTFEAIGANAGSAVAETPLPALADSVALINDIHAE